MTMRDPQGRFIATTKIVLRPGTRGKNNRNLALHRRTKLTKKPRGFHLSHQPRSL